MSYVLLLATITFSVLLATTENPLINIHDKFWGFILASYIFMSVCIIIQIVIENINKRGDKK